MTICLYRCSSPRHQQVNVTSPPITGTPCAARGFVVSQPDNVKRIPLSIFICPGLRAAGTHFQSTIAFHIYARRPVKKTHSHTRTFTSIFALACRRELPACCV